MDKKQRQAIVATLDFVAWQASCMEEGGYEVPLAYLAGAEMVLKELGFAIILEQRDMLGQSYEGVARIVLAD